MYGHDPFANAATEPLTASGTNLPLIHDLTIASPITIRNICAPSRRGCKRYDCALAPNVVPETSIKTKPPEPCGAGGSDFQIGGQYKARTCDPRRVKAMLYH